VPYTHADIARWRADAARNRTAVYLDIYRRTGVHQALQQASISQASGALGGTALFANRWVSEAVGPSYFSQVKNLGEFSTKVLEAEINLLEARLNAGKIARDGVGDATEHLHQGRRFEPAIAGQAFGDPRLCVASTRHHSRRGFRPRCIKAGRKGGSGRYRLEVVIEADGCTYP
jgi:hypothetical protein